MKKIAFVFVLMLFVQACTSSQTETFRGYGGGKRLTEVDAKQIIKGEASAVYLFGLFKVYDDTKYAKDVTYYQSKVRVYAHDEVSQVKAAAAYKALRNSDTDILLSPTYVIEKSNYLLWKSIDVTVYAVKGDLVGYQRLGGSDRVVGGGGYADPCAEQSREAEGFGGRPAGKCQRLY